MSDWDDEPKWLYRGVPEKSLEVQDVIATNEIVPPRRDRIGERWREFHCAGDTQTGYTSWTSDRSIAEEMALMAIDPRKQSQGIVVFRVRYDSIPADQLFDGRADEFEYLIEGRVESVEISEQSAEDE